MSKESGRIAEDKALDYLRNKGLTLSTRNYNCRVGEIDLIMRDKEYLVFIEVRSRSSMRFGGAIASITHAKRQKIMKATSFYLMTHKMYDKVPLRFDVVSIDGASGDITWLKDAFGADY
ncbi:MAG: YraN family protein [Legionellales bacterium]